jgi:hypothetical protein
MRWMLFLLLLSFSTAEGVCPRNSKEWNAKGPALLVKKAALQHGSRRIPDFSKKLMKSSSAILFRERKKEFAMVQAQDKETSLFLSGVMRCDPATKEPVLLSLSWVQGEKSGMIKVTEQ